VFSSPGRRVFATSSQRRNFEDAWSDANPRHPRSAGVGDELEARCWEIIRPRSDGYLKYNYSAFGVFPDTTPEPSRRVAWLAERETRHSTGKSAVTGSVARSQRRGWVARLTYCFDRILCGIVISEGTPQRDIVIRDFCPATRPPAPTKNKIRVVSCRSFVPFQSSGIMLRRAFRNRSPWEAK